MRDYLECRRHEAGRDQRPAAVRGADQRDPEPGQDQAGVLHARVGDDALQTALNGGVSDAEDGGRAGEQQQDVDDRGRRRAEQCERAPHAVEADVHGHARHDRAGRTGRSGVGARQPDLRWHQPDLDRETGQQQDDRGAAGRSGRQAREARQRQRAGSGDQEQQSGQQERAADPAECERDQRRRLIAGLAATKPASIQKARVRDSHPKRNVKTSCAVSTTATLPRASA